MAQHGPLILHCNIRRMLYHLLSSASGYTSCYGFVKHITECRAHKAYLASQPLWVECRACQGLLDGCDDFAVASEGR